MAIDPIGQDTYNGLGVPLYGESVLRQENSSNALLTLMHSTANTGRFLLGIDYKAENADASASSLIPAFSSLLTDLAVVDIDADGGLRMVSGTTIKYELNSSGLWSGSTLIIDSSGGTAFAKQHIVDISSDGTSAYTLLAANAGKLHMVSTGTYSSIVISLPTSGVSAITAGMWWDIYSNTTAADVIDIVLIGANGGGTVFAHHGTTDAVATTAGISHGTSGPFWVRVLCVTTGGSPEWAISNRQRARNGTSTGAFHYFTEASTVLS